VIQALEGELSCSRYSSKVKCRCICCAIIHTFLQLRLYFTSKLRPLQDNYLFGNWFFGVVTIVKHDFTNSYTISKIRIDVIHCELPDLRNTCIQAKQRRKANCQALVYYRIRPHIMYKSINLGINWRIKCRPIRYYF